MMRPPLTGPQKFLVGGLGALVIVLIGFVVASIIIPRRTPATPGMAEPPKPITWGAIKSERSAPIDGIFTAIVPQDASPEDIDRQAREHCAGRQFCKVMGWINPAAVATAFPMTEREFTTQSYSYDLNRQSGMDRSLFDCRIWKVAKSRCLAGADN